MFERFFIIVLWALLTDPLAVRAAPAHPGLSGPPNDCRHPHWRETLRCKALAVSRSSDAPQPNADNRPGNLSQLRDHTRVFLRSPTVRCLDGTRPAIFVAPAVCTQPAGCTQDGRRVPMGAPIRADDWLVSFTGGGACHVRDRRGNGIFDDGRSCTDAYPAERGEMGTALEPPMKNLGAGPGGSSGIVSRDPVANPVFAGFNSVRVEKCSYDRFNGNSEYSNVEGALAGRAFRFEMFSHGQRIAEAAIDELMNGLSYTTWGDPNGDGLVDDVPATLPALSRARRVLLVGHSGAAHGLRHNVDRLAEQIRRGQGTADVRAVIDANFLPSIEAEAGYAVDPDGRPLGGSPFSDQWRGFSMASGAPFSYDGEAFHRDGAVAAQLTSWKTRLDQSCLDAHEPSQGWKCRDRQHVLFHHLTTPMFIREDLEDPNAEHADGGRGHPVTWARLPGCAYADGRPTPECDARFQVATEHRRRLLHLFRAAAVGMGLLSELADGRDGSARGQLPSLHFWMPRCRSHDGAYSEAAFQRTRIVRNGSGPTMREALETFVAAPASGSLEWHVDGLGYNGTQGVSVCP